VDVAALLSALAAATSGDANISRVTARAEALDAAGDAPVITLNDGSRLSGANVVLAAGAWAAGIAGLPRALPVRPVKGEIAIARGTAGLQGVVFGAGGYLVPHAGKLLIGATSVDAGFDAEPTASAALELRDTARTLVRGWSDAAARFVSQRAGLRPMTPDGYPILGRDPDAPALVYACGYSRNGVLLSPLAADCTAALIAGDSPAYDLTAFSVSRFGG
jgi:glycine oxidase